MSLIESVFGRRSVASPDAPSVSLAVSTLSRLPVPPYPSVNEEPSKKGKAKLLETIPVSVKVGQEYDFITTGVIARIRVEKIWQEADGMTYVVVSQKTQNGRVTHAIHISEFKQRCISGGVKEVII